MGQCIRSLTVALYPIRWADSPGLTFEMFSLLTDSTRFVCELFPVLVRPQRKNNERKRGNRKKLFLLTVHHYPEVVDNLEVFCSSTRNLMLCRMGSPHPKVDTISRNQNGDCPLVGQASDHYTTIWFTSTNWIHVYAFLPLIRFRPMALVFLCLIR